MKKIIFSILFIGLIVPFGAKADLVSDLQAQINALLQQIQALQAQLAAQQGTTPTPTTVPTSCPNLTYNLYLGLSDSQTGGQVSMLQKFLAQDSSVYPEGQITGYFGPATERAVQRWQANSGIVSSGTPDTTGYGAVGPQTRAAIKKSCAVATPSITVLAPNGGEVWEVGKTYTIKWRNSSEFVGKIIRRVVYLNEKDSNGYFTKTKLTIADSQFTLLSNTTEEWSWYVPTDLLSGQYKIVVYEWSVDNSSYSKSDDSDASFSIQPPTHGDTVCSLSGRYCKPPVIDSVSGPATLTVGQTGTWTIKAHDPENNQMSYSVSWGDEITGYGAPALSAATPFTQTVTLTHSYSAAGIYTPTFTISDGSLSAKTSISVNVGGVATPTPSITATDSDNSPDYKKYPPSYSITKKKYPDLFVAGVGEGLYQGSQNVHYIFGQEPNPLIAKSTTNSYSTYYDHCASQSQLNEAYISDKKLEAVGVQPSLGYICQSGAFVFTNDAQKLDYNSDEILDVNDWNYLTDVFLGKQVCPTGKVCDVNQDGKPSTISDVQKLSNIINGVSPVPDFSVTPTPTPTITVLSPNGGESWEVGKTYQVRWRVANLGNRSLKTQMDLYRSTDLTTGLPRQDTVPLAKVDTNTGYMNWPIPSTVSPGNYYISLSLVDESAHPEGLIVNRDLSDAPFSIVAAPAPALSANAQNLDYNNDGKLDTSDSALLSSYWSNKTCPAGTAKICDVNRDGVFTIADVQKLTNIVLGTASVPDYKTSLLESNPQKIDYNDDGKLDTSDSFILTDVFLGKRACPANKVCDVNQDGKSAMISDVQKFTNIILGATPVPDFGAQSSSASLNQMASVLEGMKGILEQLSRVLR